MKDYCAILITVIIVLFAFIPVISATECSKSYLVQIELTPSGATEKLTQLVYGSAPLINSSSGDLRGELLARDGKTITAFWLWDPRIQLGEDIVMDKNGTAITSKGVQSRASRADLVVMLPYSPDAASFRLSDAKKNLLATVNLEKAQDALTFNCTEEMYVKMTPTKKASPVPISLPLLVVAGVVVLVGRAVAGASGNKRKNPQEK
jgi:hypothetical protein